MDRTANIASGAAATVCGPPPGELPAERLLRLVHWTSAASRQLRKKLGEVAASCALSDAELLVVWLCRGEGHVQVELAAALGISPAQMSGLVERLRARGLVEMQKQALDRRRQVWRTSPAGEALFGEVAERLAELGPAIGEVLPEEEQRGFTALCERLAEAAQPAARRSVGGSGGGVRQSEPDQRRGSKEAA